MIEINLLPGVTRKAKRSKKGINFGALVQSIGDQIKSPYLIVMIGSLIVSAVTVGGLYAHQSMQSSELETRRSAAVRDSARMAGVLKARSKAEAARDSVYMQVAIIKSIDDSRYKWPHLLQEINVALPPYTWLTEVKQTSEVTTAAGLQTDSTNKKNGAKPDATSPDKPDGQAGANASPNDAKAAARKKRAHADSLFNGATSATRFRIAGQTVDIQALTLFMKNLEGSPFIKNVQLTRSDLVSGEHDVTQFELEAESEVPPEVLLNKTPLSIAVH